LLDNKAGLGQHPASAKNGCCSQVPQDEVGFDSTVALPMTRRQIQDAGDRYQIELGEARVLLCTYQVTKQKVLTQVRMEWLEKKYGTGSVARIRDYMKKLQDGELE
tara:strand:- start:125 stop:442 length:318 start_codon:yes stop_codon:yes gene_type:complete